MQHLYDHRSGDVTRHICEVEVHLKHDAKYNKQDKILFFESNTII